MIYVEIHLQTKQQNAFLISPQDTIISSRKNVELCKGVHNRQFCIKLRIFILIWNSRLCNYTFHLT